MTDEPKDITQLLKLIEAQNDWIAKRSKQILPISDALATLGIIAGTTLYFISHDIWEATDRIANLQIQIINARLDEAQQSSATILKAALAGAEVERKQKETSC